MNIACSTCLEPITLKCDVSSTPCGHLFHTKCIKEWLNTNKRTNVTKKVKKSCPQCRKNCDYLIKLYFTEGDEIDSKLDVSNESKNEIDLLKKKNKALEENVDELEGKVSKLDEKIRKLEEIIIEAKEDSDIKVANLEVKVGELEGVNEKLLMKLNISLERGYKIFELEEKLNGLKKENTKLKKNKTKLEKKIEELEEEMNTYMKQILIEKIDKVKKLCEKTKRKEEREQYLQIIVKIKQELISESRKISLMIKLLHKKLIKTTFSLDL